MLKICYVTDGGPPQIVFEGEISADQAEHAFDAVVSAPSFTQGHGLLLDTSRQQSVRSHEEIRQLATHVASRREVMGERLAVVVAADNELQYGLARQFAVYAEMGGLSVGIFTSDHEAVRWLRAPAAP